MKSYVLKMYNFEFVKKKSYTPIFPMDEHIVGFAVVAVANVTDVSEYDVLCR